MSGETGANVTAPRGHIRRKLLLAAAAVVTAGAVKELTDLLFDEEEGGQPSTGGAERRPNQNRLNPMLRLVEGNSRLREQIAGLLIPGGGNYDQLYNHAYEGADALPNSQHELPNVSGLHILFTDVNHGGYTLDSFQRILEHPTVADPNIAINWNKVPVVLGNDPHSSYGSLVAYTSRQFGEDTDFTYRVFDPPNNRGMLDVTFRRNGVAIETSQLESLRLLTAGLVDAGALDVPLQPGPGSNPSPQG